MFKWPFRKKKKFAERELRLTMGTVKRFNQATGKDLMKGLDTANLTMGDLTALVWSLLFWEDKALTLKEVELMLDDENITDVTEKISTALNPPKLPG